jgi:hypothetical protein
MMVSIYFIKSYFTLKMYDFITINTLPSYILSKNTESNAKLNPLNQKMQEELVLLWAQLTKIYPPLPTSVLPISITKTLLIVPTKNEKDPPLFTDRQLIKFQNILRNTTQVIIRHRVKFLFSVISSPITLERQKWKSSKMKGILLSSSVNSW